MTRIKVCGITHPDQGIAVADAGADAIGLVFYGPSSRNVSVDQAAAIRRSIPAFVSVIGLFVDTPVDQINSIAARVKLDAIQFHGDQSPEQCGTADRPWYRALRVKPDDQVDQLIGPWVGHGQGILLDAYVKGIPGGTGHQFNWEQIPNERDWRLILAGGLTPENVRDAISQTRPYAVDVSGGVESEPGTKDISRVRAFIQEVRNDQHH